MTVCGYEGITTEIEIESTVQGYLITTINEKAFCEKSDLTSITIPNSITSIGSKAFYNCSGLTSITIGNGVTSIGSYAFDGCYGLTKVNYLGTIDDWASKIIFSLPSISNPLYYAKHLYLNNIEITEAVFTTATQINSFAFQNCIELKSVSIGHNVKKIYSSAFEGCRGLTSVSIPDNVTSIGAGAFSGCSGLTSISVEEGNSEYQSIDGNLYSKDGKTILQYTIGKTATSFAIPNGVTSIGNGAFSGCSGLTSITIPDSVTSIGNHAFSGCSELTSVTIPDSVTSIGYYAFYGCSGLTSITIPDSVTIIGDFAFV